MPILSGSLPAARAWLRTFSMAARHFSSGFISGNQPSPNLARRRRARSSVPPNQIGIGRWTGNGLMPASVTVCQRPLKVTRSRVQSWRNNSTCSSDRCPRFLKSCPNASYSTGFQPMPMPKRSRPPLRTSTVAACFATRTVWRCGRMIMPVVNSMFLVSPAR